MLHARYSEPPLPHLQPADGVASTATAAKKAGVTIDAARETLLSSASTEFTVKLSDATVAHRSPPTTPETSRMLSLVALLRPVAVEAFHQGATVAEVRDAMEQAIQGVQFEGGA